ncbi:hypothetical protein HRbin15_00524 [bacterium HR15]|nr:hypothetical protein HRbin15_00524 [bacterium HR15]
MRVYSRAMGGTSWASVEDYLPAGNALGYNQPLGYGGCEGSDGCERLAIFDFTCWHPLKNLVQSADNREWRQGTG